MPTGGVEPTEESLKTWFDAGVYCVGMGSNLITPEILKNKDWSQLKEKVAALVSLYHKIRK
jgi:2-dehydro-3-deoxyphosphogluconate aldolase/(4S)-4-hydroxy-2-oxoglutarate aldolase